MKTILILRHSVPIILIIGSNMPCINVLNCSHNLSMDRKFEVHLFEILVAFDLEFGMTFVDHEDS